MLDYNTQLKKLALPEYGRNFAAVVHQVRLFHYPINGQPVSTPAR